MSVQQTLPETLLEQSLPTPPEGWRWSQRWRELFFAHWRVPVQRLRPHVPGDLDIDTWNGSAWISIVAFRLDVMHRWLPSFGLTEDFVEVNLRTYVRCRDEPGIHFLSIHAGSRVAVALARLLTPLPYVYAPLTYRRNCQRWKLECGGAGTKNGQGLLAAEFDCDREVESLHDGSLDQWLLERYRAFVPDRRGRVYRMVAKHQPWLVQKIDVRMGVNNLGAHWGLDLRRAPDEGHFAEEMPALIQSFERVT